MKKRLSILIAIIATVFAFISPAVAKDPIVFVSAFAAGEDGAIHAFRLSNDGTLKPVHRTPGVAQPFFLALSPDSKYLYATTAPGQFGGTEPEQVAAFQIVGDGELKLLNHQSARGSAACYLDVDESGKSVVLANYSTGSVASYPIKEDGSLGESASFVQHEGSSVNQDRQTGPHAHSTVISPDNRFVLAADLGLDQVLVYRLDAASAKLAPNDPPFAKTNPGAGPRHITFHPNGKHVYVINELDNTVTAFDYDAKAGSLDERQTISTLPEGFAGESYCADVKVTPDGKYLYGTNRGHDSIAAYRVGEDGRLTLVAIEPSLGKGPQNLAITSSGQLLLCANMPGNNLAVFRIDATSGKLKSIGEPISVPSPSCIMIR